MPGILDLLGSLGGIATPVLNGYTSGQRQAREYLQKQKALEGDKDLKKQSLELQKQHQKFLEDEAAAQPGRDASKLLIQTMLSMREKLATDKNTQDVVRAGGPMMEKKLGDYLARGLALGFDPKSTPEQIALFFHESPTASNIRDEIVNGGQPKTQPDTRQPIDIPGAPTLMIPPELRRLGVEETPQQEGSTIMPGPQGQAPPAPTGPQYVDQNGYPLRQDQVIAQKKQEADEEYKRALINQATANTELIGERTTSEQRLREPKYADLKAGTSLKGAQEKFIKENTVAVPQRVANDRARVLNSIRDTDERIRNNKETNEISRSRVEVSRQANAILGDLRRMQTVKTGQDAAMLEVQIRRLGDSLPPDQAKLLNSIANKMSVYDQLNGKWVMNPDSDKIQTELETVLEALSKTPSPGTTGGGVNQGSNFQGAPSNATLGTNNEVGVGKTKATTQGKYDANWQVNRGKVGKPPKGSSMEGTVKDPDIRAAVQSKMNDPAEWKKFKAGLSPEGRKAVDTIRADMLKNVKASKPSKITAPPKTPQSSMMRK